MSEITYYGSTDGRQKFTLEQLFTNCINDSHMYRPTFKFFKTDTDDKPIYFGIELEFNTPEIDSRPNAVSLLQGVNEEYRHFYCKRDGSLSTGFEFNSMPMSLDYFKTFDVNKMSNLFKKSLVFASDECGFHVHISRASINDTVKFTRSLYNILPFLLFLSNRKDYQSVSRYTSIYERPNRNCDDEECDYSSDALVYAKSDGSLFTNMKRQEYKVYDSARFIAHTKKRSNVKAPVYFAPTDDRYSFINYNNDNTIEIRLFKGTTDWKYVLNILSLLKRVVELSNVGVVVDDIQELLVLANDYALQDFITENVNNMSNELLRAYWANSRGELFNKGKSYSLYRVHPNNIKAGDFCVGGEHLADLILYDVKRRGISFGDAISNSSNVFDVLSVEEDEIILCIRGWSNSSRICKIEKSKLSNLVVFRRILYVLAPFVRWDNPAYTNTLFKRLSSIRTTLEATKVRNTGLYNPNISNSNAPDYDYLRRRFAESYSAVSNSDYNLSLSTEPVWSSAYDGEDGVEDDV